jgi:hypothetical protein
MATSARAGGNGRAGPGGADGAERRRQPDEAGGRQWKTALDWG